MKKNIKYMYCMLLLAIATTGVQFSMDQGSSDEEIFQENLIDLNIDLLHAVNNYRVYSGKIKVDNTYDPKAVFRTFIWREANDQDMVLIGPSGDKQLLRYAALRLALQDCMRNNTLSYDEILDEVRQYSERYF